MARPKKISDATAVKLVDELYAQSGDPKQLKFSALETYAVSVGVNAKAYDLRRNHAVVRRIAEIEALAVSPNTLVALAYKNLDVDGFIKANKSPSKLKQALFEMDERWCKLYDYAVAVSAEKQDLAVKLSKSDVRNVELETEIAELSELRKTGNVLRSENAYLRKMIREYLYPALADEILKSPTAERRAFTESATTAMVDGDVPDTFSDSIAADQQLCSREDMLLEKLRRYAKE